jgi:hypothetical protein
MNLQTVFQSAPQYKSFLYGHFDNSPISWRYLPLWIEYQKAYCQNNMAEDCSFLLAKDEKPVAFCPLFIEDHHGSNFFSYGLSYQAAPFISKKISKKVSKKIEKICFDQIDVLAKMHGVLKSMLQLNPVDMTYSFNILVKYGYLDSSIQTAVVDLNKDIATLWSELRKSFKSLINNGRKKFNIIIIDKQNPDYDVHERYRQLHHKTAGRITRSQLTFDLQFQAIKNDNAMLIGLQDGEQYVAFSYFLHDKKAAYYGSSSDDPAYESAIPLEHCIIWKAIEYYQERGLEILEIGVQQFGPQIFDHPSPKDITISFFKRGFGVKILPFYRGIKYFDKELMQRDLMSNVAQTVKDQNHQT